MDAISLDSEAAIQAYEKCRVCTGRLSTDEGDDFEVGVCRSCSTRPEAKRLGAAHVSPQSAAQVGAAQAPARAFTPAEKSLISKMYSILPSQQLLDLLNERLAFDLGPDAGKYNMVMLNEQIAAFAPSPAASMRPGAGNWAGLRKVLAQAERSGVLGRINKQVINDFAVVFSLTPKQVLTLEDIVLKSQEEE